LADLLSESLIDK